MPDDYETVDLRRKAREIEILREHYREHRETLMQLAGGAPTEHLATEYQRLVRDIDVSMHKLDELDGQPMPAQASAPGMRPLVTTPQSAPPAQDSVPRYSYPDDSAPRSRVPIIVVAGVAVLALLGWLIWRSSGERPAAPITQTTATIVETAPPVTPAPESAAGLRITPVSADYGTVHKGTRATRQFEVANNTTAPIVVQVGRSQCRCLFYEHANTIPSKGTETLTVTVDAARAKHGALSETVKVSSKKDASIVASFAVNANIE
jgi:hypothetical protein